MVAAVAVAAIGQATAGAKPAPVKVRKVVCEYVVSGAILPLKGNSYEGGKVRCRAQLKMATTSEDSSLPVQIALSQAGKDGAAPVKAIAKVDANVWPGFKHWVEAEVALPEKLDGCSSFQVELTVGAITRKIEANAECGD